MLLLLSDWLDSHSVDGLAPKIEEGADFRHGFVDVGGGGGGVGGAGGTDGCVRKPPPAKSGRG